ncbi:hypothetical protein RJZ56_007390 [Blastomyces dermatitidis]|uniref:DUF7770 domain-containing protein n=2 Tax=Blastomyces TaxID=229219 RepID=A0A179V2I4_BLAGS|nr:uncharacterized protein BDBG_08120 [Blastomyces gilchristii SLH14081]XP_045271588.1 uncharacterized protein BDCG_00177 [Blastomyces dermatitidis ER-3]EEQ83372.1 hypothetical protein BDCG_00177 [Blastomyces dermatitidis ER-3]EQL35905.1 hypothetical protein BDFG_02507 [Blastomyces dermatitidis ATCC 26199]OAT12822.1 hypothetical protein BDBG_08120 [Blastomyces gilchristii SLH14081]
MNFNDMTVAKVRFVVHTMGKSRNHWSIYLILQGETSYVRLNMSLANGGDENGTFSATLHPYALSDSRLTYFDYHTCANPKVLEMAVVIECMGTVFLDMTSQGYIPLSDNERNGFMQRMQNRYHRNAQGHIVQLPDPMEIGEFY